jgi:hypothetical protein
MALKSKPSKPGRSSGEDRVLPTATQEKWLVRGLQQAGGKLPLFDEHGKRVSERTVKSCLKNGWAEPWFDNPIKPDWQICKLTDSGRQLLRGSDDQA